MHGVECFGGFFWWKVFVVKRAELRGCLSLCSDIFAATGCTLKLSDFKRAACFRLSSVRALITPAKQRGSLQTACLIPQLPLSCDYLLLVAGLCERKQNIKKRRKW